MLYSLFEMFDPLMGVLYINFTVLLIVTILPMMMLFYVKKHRMNTMHSNTKNYMFSELSAAISNKNNTMNILFLFSCFMFILMLNLMGMLPYVYTLTSQMLFTLSLALPVWLTAMMYNFTQNTTHFISHLVPLSTPMALSHFMTLIESISLIIRPITLSVRLCANMTAGHILMALSSSTTMMLSLMSIPLSMLLILELAVAFIQSYVFTMLLSMYISETE